MCYYLYQNFFKKGWGNWWTHLILYLFQKKYFQNVTNNNGENESESQSALSNFLLPKDCSLPDSSVHGIL